MSDIQRKGRLNAGIVLALTTAGCVCLAASFYGRQTPLIEYCFKPVEVLNPQDFCTPEKRYLMSVPFISPEQQPANPKYLEDWQLPEHATLLRTIPPTNPYKWLWGLGGTAFFGVAGALSKAREKKLLEFLPQYREEIKSSWILNQIRVLNHQRKVEYAARLDYQLWQFGADRAARAKQFSMLSPEEIQVFQEQARVQAASEARQITQSASTEPAGYLSGQTLDEVTAPGDKLSGGIEWFNWDWLRTQAENFPHIRLVAVTNGGKTTLADWLVDLIPADERFVITVKRKPHQWRGLGVVGVPEQYEVIRDKLEWLETERKRRFENLQTGIEGHHLLVVVDEWRAIAKNCKPYEEEDVKHRGASQMMGDLITLAREANIRLLALAQSQRVKAWGLEGEGDLLECFASIYLGVFALEKAQARLAKSKEGTEEHKTWQEVINKLRRQGKRAAWIESEQGDYPAIVPELSDWKREVSTEPVSNADWRSKLEGLIDNQGQPSQEIPENNEQALSENAQKVLAYIKRKLSDPLRKDISIRAIQQSRCVDKLNKPGYEEVIQELIAAEEVILNEEGNVELTNN
ncbi:MAG: hypothetical protein F6K09_01250 [Merismopedia sp. SIO2A8]|nr:hypothetical protein [Symploca sp. SIO2B6]NET47355.1 hypothetical protein [Merismopedia sp. SIO2A8]